MHAGFFTSCLHDVSSVLLTLSPSGHSEDDKKALCESCRQMLRSCYQMLFWWDSKGQLC